MRNNPRCIHTPNLGFLPQKGLEICYDTIILETWSKVEVNSDPKIVLDTLSSKDASTHLNFGFLPQIMLEICYGHDYSRYEVTGQGHSDQDMVCGTLPPQDASIHQILNSYLK